MPSRYLDRHNVSNSGKSGKFVRKRGGKRSATRKAAGNSGQERRTRKGRLSVDSGGVLTGRERGALKSAVLFNKRAAAGSGISSAFAVVGAAAGGALLASGAGTPLLVGLTAFNAAGAVSTGRRALRHRRVAVESNAILSQSARNDMRKKKRSSLPR